MFSAFDEIKKIRGSENININANNRNRHSVLISEKDNSITSYTFSAPIYNVRTRKLVQCMFLHDENKYLCEGSNSTTVIDTDRITMSNDVDRFTIGVADRLISGGAESVAFSTFTAVPTLNGIQINATSTPNGLSLFINMDKPYMNVRSNTKAFTIMHEKFVPLMSVSPIGVTDQTGQICAPCKLECARTSDHNFIVKISPMERLGCKMVIEINMYEHKLVQDTTVDSANTDENNAFGTVAFVGNSSGFGEQMLYSRIDFSKLSELLSRKISKASMYFPVIGGSRRKLDAYKVAHRFCSFGSTWDSKVSESQFIGFGTDIADYISFDISKQIINPINKQLYKNEGLILHTNAESNGFTVLSTGDSEIRPQILEINYR